MFLFYAITIMQSSKIQLLLTISEGCTAFRAPFRQIRTRFFAFWCKSSRSPGCAYRGRRQSRSHPRVHLYWPKRLLACRAARFGVMCRTQLLFPCRKRTFLLLFPSFLIEWRGWTFYTKVRINYYEKTQRFQRLFGLRARSGRQRSGGRQHLALPLPLC